MGIGNNSHDHRRAFFCNELADPARGFRIDGAHVDVDSAAAKAGEHAVGPERHALDVGRIGKHGDDEVGAFRHFARCSSRSRTRSRECGYGRRHHVADDDLITLAEDVAGHGRAHGAESNEAYDHDSLDVGLTFVVDVCRLRCARSSDR